ncbi:MAG: CDP-glucose 4,6-dehydratase [Deltaproteobacteria bacterium HGW-Deltaproteobacteria-13]|jgi:CDP-glucose 4,6-dehydratase|nr:MAG: CDP-glucose 4,6-dehydratase [Deltaproteobacteria bacterium HGW-Deltaproteobacteria-13]
MRNVSPEFWKRKKVFITGHTGFKGSWLSFWLHEMGASVTGYALSPPTNPSLFELLKLKSKIKSVHGDVRDLNSMKKHIKGAEIVFHLAAQPLVLESYKNPVDTYATNVMGTINLLEAFREHQTLKAIVNVTTDKCFENRENPEVAYKENEPMGGFDPYSNSKACSELVTDSYRKSFYQSGEKIGIATARAGNVIGGGDFAADRLIPDCIRGVMKGEKIIVRNPDSTRPWQHVLEPLSGYLILAESLCESPRKYSEGWNFGPSPKDAKSVLDIMESFCKFWGEDAKCEIKKDHKAPHEANYLKLDSSKAQKKLLWKPRWNSETAIKKTVEWYKAYMEKGNLDKMTSRQIESYYG